MWFKDGTRRELVLLKGKPPVDCIYDQVAGKGYVVAFKGREFFLASLKDVEDAILNGATMKYPSWW